MIIRQVVECPGCRAKIVLRISVGYDLEQPFYFVCSRCNAATRAKQIIWYNPQPGNRLELEAGRLLDNDENPDQIITLHPDLPAKAEAQGMMEPGGSPFLMLHSILGDKFENFMTRLHILNTSVENWTELRRWIGYYNDRNWPQFDIESERILGKAKDQAFEEWQRHDLIHRTLDEIFAPLWTHPYYHSDSGCPVVGGTHQLPSGAEQCL
jgi:hypothetical protein